MGHSQQLEAVRTLVRDRFARWSGQQVDEWCETILVLDGCYWGRRFVWGAWQAEWGVLETSVRFIDDRGEPREIALGSSSIICDSMSDNVQGEAA